MGLERGRGWHRTTHIIQSTPASSDGQVDTPWCLFFSALDEMDAGESDCLTAYTGLDPVFSLEVLSDVFVYGSHSGVIKGFSLQNGLNALELRGHTGTVKEILSSNATGDQAEQLFSCSADGTIRIWDVESVKCVGQCRGHQGSVETICYSEAPGEKPLLLSGGMDGCVKMWNTGDATCERTIKTHIGRVDGIQKVGSTLYTCSVDGLAKAVDIEKGQLTAIFEGTCPIHCMQYRTHAVPPESGEEETHELLLGCADGHIRSYDTRTAKCVKVLEGHKERVYNLALCEGVLYSTSDDATIKHWHLETCRPEYTYRGHTDGIPALRVASNGTFYTGSYDKSVRVWDRNGIIEKLRIGRLLDDDGYRTQFNFAARLGANQINRSGAASAQPKKGAKSGKPSRVASAPPSAGKKSTGRPQTSQAQSPNKSAKQKEALERELSAYTESNLSSIHLTFLKYIQDNGNMQFPEFQRCLAFLGVGQLPLVEKVWSIFKEQSMNNGIVNYRQIIHDINQIVNGPDKEKLYRSCWKLYDPGNKGAITKGEMERIKNEGAMNLGRTELQANAMCDLFKPIEDTQMISYTEFVDSLQTNPRLVQAFLVNIFLNMKNVVS